MFKNGRFVSYPSLGDLTSLTLITQLIPFLDQYPIGDHLYRIPFSRIKDDLVATLLAQILHSHLPPTLPVFRRKSLGSNRIRVIAPLLLPNNVIIVPKVLHSPADAQVLCGRLWYLSASPWTIIPYIYDPAGFFQKIPHSIPPQIHPILHPKPHSSKKIYPDPARSIQQGGFSIYDGHHPAMHILDNYCDQTYTACGIPPTDPSSKEAESDRGWITFTRISELLAAFPMAELCADSRFADPILTHDGTWSEKHFEWIISYFLRRRFLKWTVNQFRTDKHIFDLYLDDQLIIEFKYLKNRTEYFRLIGQLWEYAEYKKNLLGYIIGGNKNLTIDPQYLPPNCTVVQKICRFEKDARKKTLE